MQNQNMERAQINVRVEFDLLKKLDEKRTELLAKLGYIPSRSDLVRIALEEFLK